MAQILVVDDEVQACQNLRSALSQKGHSTFEANDGKQAIEVLGKRSFELVFLDIRMPVMNGFETLKIIKRDYPDTEVVMVTAVSDLRVAMECIHSGAYGYIAKPVNFETLFIEADKALERRALVLENREYQNNLEKKVEKRTEQVNSLAVTLQESFLQFVRVFLDCLELYDPFLGGHSKRVAILSIKIGEAFNLNSNHLEDLEFAGFLHDLGTLGIPERIRNSRFNELTEKEVELVKKQTILSQEALSPINRFNNVGKIIRNHLERVDGGGFPDGQFDDDILFESKILSVVNAYDEVKFRRRFEVDSMQEQKKDEEIAIDHLKEFSGKKFNSLIVDKLVSYMELFELKSKQVQVLDLDQLKEGMVLAKDLKAKNQKKLVGEGLTLSPLLIAKIRNYHLHISTIIGKIYVYR